LAAARQLALRRLTVHEIATGRGEIVCGPRAVGPLLLANYEQKIDAIFALIYELLRGRHHCRCDSFCVARAAAVEAVAAHARRMVGRDRIEVRGESDSSAAA